MNIQNFIKELRRRNVFRVATAYAIASWLLAQIANVFEEALELPTWFDTVIVSALLIGFPVAVIFAWAFELTPEGIKKSKEVEITESVTNRTGKKLNSVIITVLSMAVIFLLVERVFFAEASILEDAGMTTNFETASVAVLPFVNMSSDEENEYFSDGLSEELLNALAKVKDLKVAGRTSSFKFKGQNENITAIGQELGVAHVLEGSVRKDGNRVRITAQLIKVDDGYHVWSETYDRELNDIFAIQEEISKTVLNELKIRLLPGDNAELEDVPTTDIEAYQAYLKGNSLVAERDIDKINLAIDLYKNALRLDPTFSEAYARIAIAYNLQGFYGNIPFDQMQVNTKENAEKALSINTNEPNAYAALGLYYGNTFEAEKAKEYYLKSLELNSNNPDVYNWLANTYNELGELQKGNEAHKKMYEVDPLAPFSIYTRALVYYFEGEYDKAIEFFERNMRENPEFALSYTGMAQMMSLPPFGKLDESFKYSSTAKAYGRDSRATGILLVRAIDLQMEGLADYYFNQLKSQYGDSYEYISYIPYYSIYKKDFTYLEKDMFSYIDDNEVTIPGIPFYLSLKEYVKKTGDYDRVLKEFKKFEPSLFQEEIPPLTVRSFEQALALSEIYGIQGNTSESNKLVTAYCEAVENLKDQFDRQENGEQYIGNKYRCLIAEEKYEEAQPYFKTLYSDMNRRLAAWVFIEWLPNEVLQIEGYKEVIDEVNADLDQQRSNVIEYLKAEGEWKVEWEVGNSK